MKKVAHISGKRLPRARTTLNDMPESLRACARTRAHVGCRHQTKAMQTKGEAQ